MSGGEVGGGLGWGSGAVVSCGFWSVSVAGTATDS